MASQPIIGDLSCDMGDGTVLTASNDLTLAWKVAEHICGEADWATMGRGGQWSEVAMVLQTLRDAMPQIDSSPPNDEEE